MFSNSYLPTDNYIVADFDASREPRLGGNDDLLTNLAVVTDMHQIIDLCSPPDAGGLQGSPIDG